MSCNPNVIVARYPNGIKYLPYAYTTHGFWSLKGYILGQGQGQVKTAPASIVGQSVALPKHCCAK